MHAVVVHCTPPTFKPRAPLQLLLRGLLHAGPLGGGQPAAAAAAAPRVEQAGPAAPRVGAGPGAAQHVAQERRQQPQPVLHLLA